MTDPDPDQRADRKTAAFSRWERASREAERVYRQATAPAWDAYQQATAAALAAYNQEVTS